MANPRTIAVNLGRARTGLAATLRYRLEGPGGLVYADWSVAGGGGFVEFPGASGAYRAIVPDVDPAWMMLVRFRLGSGQTIAVAASPPDEPAAEFARILAANLGPRFAPPAYLAGSVRLGILDDAGAVTRAASSAGVEPIDSAGCWKAEITGWSPDRSGSAWWESEGQARAIAGLALPPLRARPARSPYVAGAVPSDNTVYSDLARLLRGTGLFDDVKVSGEDWDAGSFAKDKRVIAHIRRDPTRLAPLRAGSPLAEASRGSFVLTIANRSTPDRGLMEQSERLDRADRIVRTTLLDEANRAWGGVCPPHLVSLGKGEADLTENPLGVIRIPGEFAYLVDHSIPGAGYPAGV